MLQPVTTRRRTATLVAAVAAVVGWASEVRAETYEVALDGISFWYDGQENMDIELLILPGDTVRWLWVSGFHNVVSGFPGGGNEGDLFFSGSPTGVLGTTFEFTFLEPGVYGYHCHPHEAFGMISFVTVTPEPAGLALLGVGGLFGRRRRRR